MAASLLDACKLRLYNIHGHTTLQSIVSLFLKMPPRSNKGYPVNLLINILIAKLIGNTPGI